MNSQSLKNTKQTTKNAYYTLEKTRQQLELRKAFLIRSSIPEERTLFTQENPQQLITFQNARSTLVLDKQAIEKSDKEKKQSDQNIFENDETVDKYATDLLLPIELLLPTVTSGESSPNESDEEQSSSSRKKQKPIPASTSLDDVLSYIIDSSLLTIERDPPSNQRGGASSTTNGRNENLNFYWGSVSELLFLNIDVQISSATIKHDIRSKFNILPYNCFESMRTFYYHGKYSLLVTLSNEKQAQKMFEYFKSNSQSFRNLLGDRLELHRVTVNNLKNPTRNNTKKIPLESSQNKEPQIGQQSPCWVPIILRNLPGYFDKSNFQRLLHMVALQPSAIKSVEEPILLNQKKHCMALLSDVDSAFTLISKLPSKLREFPLFRINLHPAYSKQSWRIRDTQENPYCRFYEQQDDGSAVDQRLESYSKTNQHFQFQKYFLEDLSIIHKSFKQLRPEYLTQKEEDDQKKLSQRSTTPIYNHNSLDHDCQEQTISLNTPSAMFHPSNNNFCETTQTAAEDLTKTTRSIHNAGYSSPSDKQRVAEFTAPVNRSPDRGKKHRRRTAKDNSSNVEEQLSNSSPIKPQNHENEKKNHENESEQKGNSDNLEVNKETKQEKSHEKAEDIILKSPQQKNKNNKEQQDQDQLDENRCEEEAQLYELRQNFLNNRLREERKQKYKSRIRNKRTSSTSSSKSSSNRESSSSDSSSSRSQERTQKHKRDRKKKKDHRSTSRNNKSFSKRSNKSKEHYKTGNSSHKKENVKRKSASKNNESAQSAEKMTNSAEEQKHLSIKQRITLQNQDKLDPIDKHSSPNNSRSRSRKPEKEEDISSPKSRASYERDTQKDKISIEKNTKTGYQASRYHGKNSEERQINDKRNNSTERRYSSRNSHSNNYSHNYNQNNNYKYRDMRRGRHYSNNDSRMHSPTHYRYQNQYHHQQRFQDGNHKRSVSYADKYPKSKDQTYHKNSSQDNNNQGNNEEKNKGHDASNRNNKNRHSRSNSPQRFKHPRSFNSKYN